MKIRKRQEQWILLGQFPIHFLRNGIVVLHAHFGQNIVLVGLPNLHLFSKRRIIPSPFCKLPPNRTSKFLAFSDSIGNAVRSSSSAQNFHVATQSRADSATGQDANSRGEMCLQMKWHCWTDFGHTWRRRNARTMSNGNVYSKSW